MYEEYTPEDMLRLLRARSLSVWEEVPLLREYIRRCGITQSECAVRLGRSQSSVANRLRLLRLLPEERRAMQEAGLSERHARALLRLPESAVRLSALRTVLQRRMSVSETESFVDALLHPPEKMELEARLARVRRLLDTGRCADIRETASREGLAIMLFFPEKSNFP